MLAFSVCMTILHDCALVVHVLNRLAHNQTYGKLISWSVAPPENAENQPILLSRRSVVFSSFTVGLVRQGTCEVHIKVQKKCKQHFVKAGDSQLSRHSEPK